MADITGVKKVISLLQKKLKENAENPTPQVSVGYTQAYALYVHENMEVSLTLKNVRAGRGAKYLETPYRQMMTSMVQHIRDGLKARKPLAKLLMVEGLLLQRASQKLVPIDTGALRASAFTRLE